MTIKVIKEELKTSDRPLVRSLHHNTNFRVLIIAFKKEMQMKAHTAKWPSKLTVLEGAVNYTEVDQTTSLHQYDEYDIPVDITHSVKALQDSLCLLTQSNQ